MTTYRKYIFTLCVKTGHEQVSRHLAEACERHWWFAGPKVTGQGLGVLQLEIQVGGRDRWFVHKRAMELAEEALYGLGPVPVPEWETLPPHEHRGYSRWG